jgi:type I restriction enzyme S subunit
MKNGWEKRTLSELCTLISGRHLDPKQQNTESRGIGYLTGPADFGALNPVISRWTEDPQAIAKRGDILVTVKGAGVGKINFLDADNVAISRQLGTAPN